MGLLAVAAPPAARATGLQSNYEGSAPGGVTWFASLLVQKSRKLVLHDVKLARCSNQRRAIAPSDFVPIRLCQRRLRQEGLASGQIFRPR
jgi:hypothetical protein